MCKLEEDCQAYFEEEFNVWLSDTHSIEDGWFISACVSRIRQTFRSGYACDMFVVGADFYDFKTGDFEVIREYIKPISR